MKKTVCYFRGEFTGIYGWGTGWDMSKKAIWDKYWQNVNPIFWHFFVDDSKSYSRDEYLVSVDGSIYLHPMSFGGGLFDCGCICNGKYFEGHIRELIELCQDCAKVCGATFTFKMSDETEINLGELKKVG